MKTIHYKLSGLRTALIICMVVWGVFASAQDKAYQASQLLARVNDDVAAGDMATAKAKIYASIDHFPTIEVFESVKKIMDLPDLETSNEIMDYLIKKVETYSADELLVYKTNLLTPHTASYVTLKKNRALYHFNKLRYEINRRNGSKKHVLYSLEQIVKLPLQEDPNLPFDEDYFTQQALTSQLYAYQGEFDKARQSILNRPKHRFMPKEVDEVSLAFLYAAEGRVDETLSIAQKLQSGPFEATSNVLMFYVYSLQGNDETLAYYEKLLPEVKEGSRVSYQLALYYLQKQNYTKTLEYLEQAKMLAKSSPLADMVVENWEFNTTLGDVYRGLQDFVKARTYYQAALLYDASYPKAIEGLGLLESEIATIKQADTEGPAIQVLQPAVRGLKIVSADKLLIKGKAQDPSGLWDVSIDGSTIYFTEAGDFWAEVPAQPGMNTYLITAIDKANNKGTKTLEFEVEAQATNDAVVPALAASGKNYCLLIASQNYTDGSIPSLNNPIMDAVKLKVLLKNNYGFSDENIISLFNPTVNDLQLQLKQLKLTLKEEDNLLIFYAGHGIWKEQEEAGYWLMTDSRYADVNTWLPNRVVLDEIANIPSRNILLITDACFSGSVFKTRGLSEKPMGLREMGNKITRVALTSGNDTEVPDESVFMKYLVKALSENKEPYLTAQKMFINHILEAVITETKTEPRYGTLEMAGHIGGDFIFMKR